jgi:hypothetical protein
MTRPGNRAPTARERDRIVACKSGPCMACCVLMDLGALTYVNEGCDYHHLLSGGIRKGHRYGIGLCGWHHRACLEWGMTAPEMREAFGPSLMDGSRLFHAAYGSDDELLARQDALIGWTDTEAA